MGKATREDIRRLGISTGIALLLWAAAALALGVLKPRAPNGHRQYAPIALLLDAAPPAAAFPLEPEAAPRPAFAPALRVSPIPPIPSPSGAGRPVDATAPARAEAENGAPGDLPDESALAANASSAPATPETGADAETTGASAVRAVPPAGAEGSAAEAPPSLPSLPFSAAGSAAAPAALDLLREAVAARLEYPRQARRRGMQGRVVVAIRVDADGRLEACAVETGSGFPVLDEAARALVEGLFPFPRDLGGAFSARLEIDYVLRPSEDGRVR